MLILNHTRKICSWLSIQFMRSKIVFQLKKIIRNGTRQIKNLNSDVLDVFIDTTLFFLTIT